MATQNNTCLLFKRIDFLDILPVWKHHLWPHRESPIETHSAMTWPGDYPNVTHDMSIFQYPATYWGAYLNDRLLGVNSGHRTSHDHYRSRGLWVDPDYRLQGISQLLFEHTILQAMSEDCILIWSLPRISALRAYQASGFETLGTQIVTDTSNANIYVKKII